MSMVYFLLYLLIALAIAATIYLLFIKNLFHAALVLLIVLLALAAIYIVLWAPFIGVAQILIYAGGILILIIFGIMITNKIDRTALKINNKNLSTGVIIAFSFFLLLAYSILQIDLLPEQTIVQPSNAPLKSFGFHLLTDRLVHFEIAGWILLIALVGASVVATSKRERS